MKTNPYKEKHKPGIPLSEQQLELVDELRESLSENQLLLITTGEIKKATRDINGIVGVDISIANQVIIPDEVLMVNAELAAIASLITDVIKLSGKSRDDVLDMIETLVDNYISKEKAYNGKYS